MEINQDNKPLLHKLSNSIRILVADAVEKASSGHPGMPLGFADVMTVLAFNFLHFSPTTPKWPGRDRLILSAGHGSMLLYAFYYLAGYKDFTLDDIKNFRQLQSKTAGHPEYGIYEAIETTTGPLGQGFASSVGMAIAAKKNSNNHKIYTIVGDGCLMEGISYEAASLAGHLSLNNLIVLFDDNKITIDGATSLAVSENHLKKFEALGWIAEEIDGHDFKQINEALTRAQNATKPYFIACRTIIGYGANKKSASEASHGAPLGADEIKYLKQKLEWSNEPFFIPDNLLKLWREIPGTRERDVNRAWPSGEYTNKNIAEGGILNSHSDYLTGLPRTIAPRNDANFSALYNNTPSTPEATRVSSGKVLSHLLANNPKIIAGSADLSSSNNIKSSSCKPITKDDFDGNFIHYGIREHTMGAVMNGLALEGFIPAGGTFLVFSDYMRPSIRLSAIMGLKVIYIMTHDSIGVGEDGPTHQPIEHLASLRAIPNLTVFRPADYIETAECWEIALNLNSPSLIALSRQNLPQIRHHVQGHNKSSLGAYIIESDTSMDCRVANAPRNDDELDSLNNHEVTIFASGSEVHLALETAKLLPNHKVRVISVPSVDLFFKQDESYIESLLGGNDLKVAIEAGCSVGWHKIIGRKGLFFGIDEFGHSAPASKLFELFGLKPETIAAKIKHTLS
jgi:transketolase